MTAVLSYQMLDARVLTMLRTRELTRYQIQELLGDIKPPVSDGALNKLLDTLWTRGLIGMAGQIRYTLTKRGQGAVMLIDHARNVRRVDEDEASQDESSQRIPSELLELMKRSPVRGCASEADLRPAPSRRGSLQFLEAPSRFGDRLHYRDGRVTDMAGNPL